MKHETEHLNIKNGELLGLLDIKAEKAVGGDLWDKLDQVIYAYAKVHKAEMDLLVIENKRISNERMTNAQIRKKGGAMMRWGCAIPPGLMFKLEVIEPMLFSNKKLFHKFLKKYKGFRICKEV